MVLFGTDGSEVESMVCRYVGCNFAGSKMVQICVRSCPPNGVCRSHLDFVKIYVRHPKWGYLVKCAFSGENVTMECIEAGISGSRLT